MTKRARLRTQSLKRRNVNLLLLLGAAALLAAGAASVRGSGCDRPSSQEAEETLQLVIGDGGFEPAQVTRRPGKFLLTADDRRGDKSHSLKLKLSREDGNLLREIEVPEQATDWAEELDLPAGRYVLTESSHSAWSCSIVVE